MRRIAHHDHGQKPERMKFCASFSLAPKGREIGATSWRNVRRKNGACFSYGKTIKSINQFRLWRGITSHPGSEAPVTLLKADCV